MLRRLLIIGLLCLLWAGAALAQTRDTLEVHLSGSVVKVRDLFPQKSAKEMAPVFRRHWDVPIMYAPIPGRQQTLSSSYLKKKLATLPGVSPEEIDLPPKVRLIRPGQRVPEKTLSAIFLNQAKKRFRGELEVTGLRITGKKAFTEGKLTLTPQTSRIRTRNARMEIPVVAKVDGTDDGRFTITGSVAIVKMVVVTTQKIPRGEPLSDQNLEIKPHPMAPEAPFFSSVKEPMGRSAAQTLRAGTILTPAHTRAPLAVKRRDAVRIIYTKNNMRIQTLGVAEKQGAIGDVIPVRNTKSKKRITCRIIGQRLVTPLF